MPLPVLCLLSDHMDRRLGRLHAFDSRLNSLGYRDIGVCQEPVRHSVTGLGFGMSLYRTHQVS